MIYCLNGSLCGLNNNGKTHMEFLRWRESFVRIEVAYSATANRFPGIRTVTTMGHLLRCIVARPFQIRNAGGISGEFVASRRFYREVLRRK